MGLSAAAVRVSNALMLLHQEQSNLQTYTTRMTYMLLLDGELSWPVPKSG